MKKALLAVLMVFAICLYLRAADGFISVKTFQADGFTVTYDWAMDRADIKGPMGSAGIVLNYPFVTSQTKNYRTDSAPYILDGELFISPYTAEKIRGIVSSVAAETEAPVEVRVVGAAKTPVPENTHEPIKEKTAVENKIIPEPTAAPQDNSQAIVVEKDTVAGESNESVKIVEPIKKSSLRKLIVLDPGHGGNDPGATGYNGLKEKDVVLSVARLVKQHLKNYNADVLLTRSTDDFITLKNRAIFANSRKADLFVSIHCNASDNRTASGTRSYIYDRVASSKEAAEAAKFENKNTGALEFLMNDLRKSAFEYLSIEAAGNIQQNLISGLKLKWLPTERAPFYVIANTNMPSVLVEIAFISNPREEEKLDNPEFKEKVAESMASGIIQYLAKVK